MNTLQVFDELKWCPSFLGVYPRDRLPKITKYPASVVINTDKASDIGEHWVAVYFNEDKFAEYFDSFGLPPLHISILRFITNNATAFAFNTHSFQNLFSSACGYYCVAFIRLRNNGYSFCDIVNIFGRNTLQNDSIAKSIVRKIPCKSNTKI